MCMQSSVLKTGGLPIDGEVRDASKGLPEAVLFHSPRRKAVNTQARLSPSSKVGFTEGAINSR